MPKAVIYVRVSSQEQVSGFSLESQETECRKYAERSNLIIVKVFREEGVSAKTVEGRPELLNLINYCQDKRNEVSKILVYKLDRWSRSTEKGLIAISLLAKHGVELISVTEPSENTAFGKAMRSMMLVFAELDNNVKSERTKAGMVAAFSSGRWPWKAKIGYRHTTVDEKKKIVLLPPYKPLLSLLFEEAATGVYTKRDLAERLNKRGFGELWGYPATEKTIDKIIKSKFYYGTMEANMWNIEAKGTHETVTDENTWLKANKNLYSKTAPSRLSSAIKFPLRGFVLCGSCDRPLTASTSTGNGGKYSYYHCSQKGCINRLRVPQERLENEFKQYINQFTLSEPQKLLLQAILTKKLEKTRVLHLQEIKRINQSLNKISQEKLSILNNVDNGTISQEEGRQLLEELRTKEAVLKIEHAENDIDYSENDVIIGFTKHLTENVGRFWEELEYARKQKLQAMIFPEKVFYKDNEFRTNKLSHAFGLIKQFTEASDRLVNQLYQEWNSIQNHLERIYHTFQKFDIQPQFAYAQPN